MSMTLIKRTFSPSLGVALFFVLRADGDSGRRQRRAARASRLADRDLVRDRQLSPANHLRHVVQGRNGERRRRNAKCEEN